MIDQPRLIPAETVTIRADEYRQLLEDAGNTDIYYQMLVKVGPYVRGHEVPDSELVEIRMDFSHFWAQFIHARVASNTG
jgi:hypothetical protein